MLERKNTLGREQQAEADEALEDESPVHSRTSNGNRFSGPQAKGMQHGDKATPTAREPRAADGNAAKPKSAPGGADDKSSSSTNQSNPRRSSNVGYSGPDSGHE